MPKTEHWQWYVEEFSPTETHHHALEETYYAGRTKFQSVAVVRSATFGKMLILDGDTQSSQGDERIYHETLVHPALAGAGDRSRVLILGGGEGATLREVLRCAEVQACTMVDIDGDVVDLSKRYLAEWGANAWNDKRANVIIGDALKFLRESKETFGVIISDLTEPLPDSPSNPLFNADVFRDIKARLRLASQHGCVSQYCAARQDGAHAAHVLSVRALILDACSGVRYGVGVSGVQRQDRSCSAESSPDRRIRQQAERVQHVL